MLAARVLVAVLLVNVCLMAEPVRLIVDTDIGNDVDDVIALAMTHALVKRGEAQLLAVTITKDNRWAAPFVDLLNTFYGRPAIPIGMVKKGVTPDDGKYLKEPCLNPAYPHRMKSSDEAQDAVELLLATLRAQPDGSVTVVQIGFSTNLAKLISTEDGLALAKSKVKLLSVMGGNFKQREPEYNIYSDADSARVLLAKWPGPIVFSGFEVGNQVPYALASIEKDYSYAAHHPVVDAYRLYVPKGEGRPNWDPTALLYAVRPDRGYFELSEPGTVDLDPKPGADGKAVTRFHAEAGGNCRYLIVPEGQVPRIEAVIESLASEPAAR